jgi:CHRD domain
MRRIAGVTLGVVLVIGATIGTMGFTQGGFHHIREFLTGYEEVATGIAAISTTGNGKFVARINKDQDEIDYWLKYDDLEGAVTQAHIHFGQRSTAGGIIVWLCGTTTNPGPAGTPTCPAPGEWVSGTLSAANVLGPLSQGIEPGAFEELLGAVRAGRTYVNVHTTKWGSGEIRSQIDPHGGH